MLIMVAGVTVFAEGLAGNVQKALDEWDVVDGRCGGWRFFDFFSGFAFLVIFFDFGPFLRFFWGNMCFFLRGF